MKPWEKFGNQAQVTAKPWEKFGTQSTAPQEEYVNEAHSDIGVLDRLAVKALGNSDESSIKFLQQRNPNMTFKVKDGEIYTAPKGENKYYRLDPNQLASDYKGGELDRLKEAGQDALDLAYDIPAGMAQGLATAAGGVAGFVGGGGVGALPGASAAGAASGAGLEYLRQKLGKALGVNEDIKGGQVGMAGLFGAASPLLFGAGNTQAVAKNIAPKAATEELVNASKGLGSRLWEKLRFATSSVPQDAIEGYQKFKPEVDETIDNGGIISRLEGVQQNMDKTTQGDLKTAGKALDDLYSGSDKTVDVESTKNVFKSALNEFDNLGRALTPGEQARYNSIKQQYDDLFKLNYNKPKVNNYSQNLEWERGLTPEETSLKERLASQVKELQNKIDDPNLNFSPIEKQQAAQSQKSLMQEIQSLESKGASKGSARIQGQDIIDDSTYMDPLTLQQVQKPSELPSNMSLLDAFNKRKEIDAGIEWAPKDPSRSHWLNNKEAQSARTNLNTLLDEQTGDIGKKLRGAWQNEKELRDVVEQYAENPQKLYQTLSGLNNKQYKTFKERLMDKFKDKGIDLDKEYKIVQAMNYFEDPKHMPVSSGGTTSTSYSTLGNATGDLAAAATSTIFPSYTAVKTASGLGNFLGNYAASPASIKKFIDMNRNQAGPLRQANYYAPTLLDLLGQQNQSQK